MLGHISYFLRDFSGYLILILICLFVLIFTSLQIIRSDRSDSKKKLIVTFIFSIFLLILIFSFFEAYFRYRFDESDSLGFLKVNNKWMQRHVIYNNYFTRDRDFERKKKEGTARIGIIGDSITFGYGIKNVNNRFSNILEKKLKDAKYNVEVYNLGKSGFDTPDEIEEYNKNFKQLNFDIIVWEYFLNDAQPKGKSKGTKVLLKERAKGELTTFLSDNSYFFDYIYWRMAAKYEKTFRELRNADVAVYYDEKNFEQHKKDVTNFIAQLKNENRKIIVIVFPFMYFFPNYPALDIHKRMDNIFKENGVELIDLLGDLKDKYSKDLIISQFDYHPNEFVHKIAADRLSEKIIPFLK